MILDRMPGSFQSDLRRDQGSKDQGDREYLTADAVEPVESR